MLTDRRKFLQQICMSTAGISLASYIPHEVINFKRGSTFLRSIPESEGISSESILSFIDTVEKNKLGLHSLMVARHGKIVAEGWWDPYKPDLKHMLFSLSKSFTSTAIGFVVAEGKLSVEDKVVSFFSTMLPASVSANLAAMRVKDILTMTSGHDKDTMPPMRLGNQSWIKTFLSLPVEHQPGSFFLYNSGATYMLSAIVQKLTGKTVLDYLKPRFFDPLEIRNADWETSPEGINAGAYGLRVKTEDIAKLGQFYLQKGMWNGKQLLPVKWVEEATSFQVPNASLTAKDEQSDWQQGYGYQFWRCRHNIFRGDGAVGQYSIVMPEQDTVVAITSETANMQAVMNAVWDHLLAGMKGGILPVNKSAYSTLQKKLSTLTLLPSNASTHSPIVANITGKTFKLEENSMKATEVSFTFLKDSCLFNLKDANRDYSLLCGLNHLERSESVMPGDGSNLVQGNNKETKQVKVAAAAFWRDDATFEMTWMYYETPHSDTVTCTFNNTSVSIAFKSSLVGKMGNFKETRPVLEGGLKTNTYSR